MIYVAAAISAVVPSLLLMWYFHRRDIFREPARDLWLAFAAGVLVTLPVLIVAMPLELAIDRISSPLLYGLTSALVQAALPEELFKLVMLWRVVALLALAPLVVGGEWILALRLSRRLRLAQFALEPGRWPLAGRGERWSSLLLTVAGGVLASLGGVVVLVIGFLLLTGHPDAEPLAPLLAGGVLTGITPSLIGVALFLWGVRRLNEHGRADS